MLRRVCNFSSTFAASSSRFAASASLFSAAALSSTKETEKLSKEQLAKAWMQLQYEWQGYVVADYDPLKAPVAAVPELQPEFYGLDAKEESVQKMITNAKQLFCGSLSGQYAHLNSAGQTEWIHSQVMSKMAIPAETKRRVFHQLLEADGLEQFFNKRFVGIKRFGLEGGESLIPGLWALLETISDPSSTADKVVIGMAHRGRLQVLHNICGKPLWQIFREFNDVIIPGTQLSNKGDVKYHKGHKTTHKMPSGKVITVECMPNPSHLEAVNPVATGYCRGLAELADYNKPHSAVPVLVHGDAAVIGQGVCFETMVFEELRDYNVGGTIHVVVNNQVGFTTDPSDSRSVKFCTGPLAYLNNSPVIRVNGDQPLRVAEAFRLAARHRQEFREDVFIDLVCYRRRGHNEGDSAEFTQPLLYKKIRNHPTTAQIMEKSLLDDGVVTQDEVDAWKEAIEDGFKEQYNKANDPNNSAKPMLLGRRQVSAIASAPTGVPLERLQQLAKALVPSVESLPDGFKPHPNVWKSCIEQREKSLSAGHNIIWATAELLALGSLVQDGKSVRYSGEDVQRGTWAQRHFVLHNTDESKKGDEFCSLKQLAASNPGKYGTVTLANSPLSEYAVAGFDFGYSVARPDSLVLWEAQFGDFANTAQIVWDQFLSSSCTKWQQRCSLVLSLPHGFDGQGPEHSSARVERFLQNCNEPVNLPDSAAADSTGVDPNDALKGRNAITNWTICYPTTPANYFHMLRRHMNRSAELRQPLVFFFSKGGLRTVGSTLAEMAEGTRFQPVIVDPAAKQAKTVVLCTGQVFSALLTKRKGDGSAGFPASSDSVAIVRLEQLAPFPYEHLRTELRQIVGAANEQASGVRFVWCQEEPKNAGAWVHVRPRLRVLMDSMFPEGNCDVEFAGRPSSASPATGYGHVHNTQLHALLKDALFGSSHTQ